MTVSLFQHPHSLQWSYLWPTCSLCCKGSKIGLCQFPSVVGVLSLIIICYFLCKNRAKSSAKPDSSKDVVKDLRIPRSFELCMRVLPWRLSIMVRRPHTVGHENDHTRLPPFHPPAGSHSRPNWLPLGLRRCPLSHATLFPGTGRREALETRLAPLLFVVTLDWMVIGLMRAS